MSVTLESVTLESVTVESVTLGSVTLGSVTLESVTPSELRALSESWVVWPAVTGALVRPRMTRALVRPSSAVALGPSFGRGVFVGTSGPGVLLELCALRMLW